MSRSKKKFPAGVWCGCKSQKKGKRVASKRFRRYTKIPKLAHIRMDFAGIMQTIGIKGRYVGFTYIRPLYGFAPFWRS